MILNTLVNELPRFSYAYADERQLHEALAMVLKAVGVSYTREYIAGPHDRFDFLCDAGVVIEAKIKGTFSEALRQIDRYCARDDVHAVVLVTTRMWAQTRPWRGDASLRGEPIRMIRVGGQAF
ncbi:MAG: hypothetical protein ACR2M1_06020 [Gemmatimonadaceae bacterium]